MERKRIAWAAGIAALAAGIGAVVTFMGGGAAPARLTQDVGGFELRIGAAGEGRPETLTLRKDGRIAFTAPTADGDGADFVTFEILQTDLNIGGGPALDLVAVGRTDQAGCCASILVIDLDEKEPRLLGQVPLGAVEPSRFIPSRLPNQPSAVLPVMDDAAESVFPGTQFAPLARGLVSWDGRRFRYDLERMKAPAPDAPPAFWVADSDLAAALSSAAGEGDFAPPAEATPDGVVAAYRAWRSGLLTAAAEDPALDPGAPASLITLALVLNEYLYAGQGAAGVAAVRAALVDRPQVAEAAISLVREAAKRSRWAADLEALNNGQDDLGLGTSPQE
jgi:hypothetical protein